MGSISDGGWSQVANVLLPRERSGRERGLRFQIQIMTNYGPLSISEHCIFGFL
jgi:hypothetical protein